MDVPAVEAADREQVADGRAVWPRDEQVTDARPEKRRRARREV